MFGSLNLFRRIETLEWRMCLVMASQSDLSKEIDKLTSTVANEIEQITASLKAKVPPEIDLSPEIKRLSALNDAIASIIPDENPAELSTEPGTHVDSAPSPSLVAEGDEVTH